MEDTQQLNSTEDVKEFEVEDSTVSELVARTVEEVVGSVCDQPEITPANGAPLESVKEMSDEETLSVEDTSVSVPRNSASVDLVDCAAIEQDVCPEVDSTVLREDKSEPLPSQQEVSTQTASDDVSLKHMFFMASEMVRYARLTQEMANDRGVELNAAQMLHVLESSVPKVINSMMNMNLEHGGCALPGCACDTDVVSEHNSYERSREYRNEVGFCRAMERIEELARTQGYPLNKAAVLRIAAKLWDLLEGKLEQEAEIAAEHEEAELKEDVVSAVSEDSDLELSGRLVFSKDVSEADHSEIMEITSGMESVAEQRGIKMSAKQYAKLIKIVTSMIKLNQSQDRPALVEESKDNDEAIVERVFSGEEELINDDFTNVLLAITLLVGFFAVCFEGCLYMGGRILDSLMW